MKAKRKQTKNSASAKSRLSVTARKKVGAKRKAIKNTTTRKPVADKALPMNVVRKKPSRSKQAGTADAPELSGVAWVGRFPDSRDLSSLSEPFKTSMANFNNALINAGVNRNLASAFRPTERAYLMHYAYLIAREDEDPETIEMIAGVNINWWHGDLASSVAAAEAMVVAYQIVHKPAFPSNHSGGRAVDLTLSWTSNPLRIANSNGTIVEIATTPRNHLNPELWAVAATYGVIKSPTDKPHWSQNGH